MVPYLKKVIKKFKKRIEIIAIGKHSRDEIQNISNADLRALSSYLGNKHYFGGRYWPDWDKCTTEFTTFSDWKRKLNNFTQGGRKGKRLRQPGVEPGSAPWEGAMIPLHHWRTSIQQCLLQFYHLIKKLSEIISISYNPEIQELNFRRNTTMLKNDVALLFHELKMQTFQVPEGWYGIDFRAKGATNEKNDKKDKKDESKPTEKKRIRTFFKILGKKREEFSSSSAKTQISVLDESAAITEEMDKLKKELKNGPARDQLKKLWHALPNE
uniref:Reverse transcriptase domain-containing protein n=1 Tax=Elaeophora elaphi TaxID=1147741 RepID=A0A0R3RLJ7_9BILA